MWSEKTDEIHLSQTDNRTIYDQQYPPCLLTMHKSAGYSSEMQPFKTFAELFVEATSHREYWLEGVRIEQGEIRLAKKRLVRLQKRLAIAKKNLRIFDQRNRVKN